MFISHLERQKHTCEVWKPSPNDTQAKPPISWMAFLICNYKTDNSEQTRMKNGGTSKQEKAQAAKH